MKTAIIAAFFSLLALSMTAFAESEPQSGDAPIASDPAQQPTTHALATTYSDAYNTRLKIHKYASFATLPLFATELALGQSLYNNPSNDGPHKGAHIAVGSGIIGLFGVNTFTGGMNMWESRKDPNGRTRRTIHGLLMIAANAGFVATAMTGPGGDHHGTLTVPANRAVHRNLAFTSIGIGTVGYVMMLFGHH